MRSCVEGNKEEGRVLHSWDTPKKLCKKHLRTAHLSTERGSTFSRVLSTTGHRQSHAAPGYTLVNVNTTGQKVPEQEVRGS